MVVLTLRRYAALLLLALAAPGFAQPVPPEVQIKAAFLYKFGAFVEWPAQTLSGADDAFTIGVVDAEEMASELERVVRGRTIHERRIEVRRLAADDAGSHSVQMLFVGAAAGERLAGIAAALRGRPVLIVTEAESSLTRGSMINFVVEQNKVRFDVALEAAERNRLGISSRLLMVARKVLSRPS